MIVDRLEILALDHVGGDARLGVEPQRDVAHHVLDELRVVVGPFGHVFLIGPLEDAVQLARGLGLGDVDQFLDPHVLAQLRLDRDVRALVVRAALRDLLRARAQARDRNHDAHPQRGLAVAAFADQRRLVIHEALDAAHGRALGDEEREGHLDVPGVGVEARGHLHQHVAERVDRDLALVVQDLDEARHVRALEIVGQVDVHVEGRDRVLVADGAVLDPHRVAQLLDPDAVDGDPARVGAALHVLDGSAGAIAISHWNVHGAP